MVPDVSPERLVASLRRWGVVRTELVGAALDLVPWKELLPEGPGREFQWFAPRRTAGGFEPLPHVTVLLAELAELRPGLRIDAADREWRLLGHLAKAVGASWGGPEPLDRWIGPKEGLGPRMSKGGFALRVSTGPNAETLVKAVGGEAPAQLILDRMTLGTNEPPRTVHRLLALEGFLERALLDRSVTQQDDLFREACESTWDPPAARQGLTGRPRELIQRAELAFRLAYIHQFAGDPRDAVETYAASIAAFPTAEAHTFQGWAWSFLGEYRKAIAACERAVSVDSDFGNPYNDLGAYYLELNEPAKALEWLEGAFQARRYDTPHFAHFNVGRALLALGRRADAESHFERALTISPGYRPASDLLRSLKRK